MQKHWLSVSIIFIAGGFAGILLAVFAGRLGIDPSAGWGRGRIALLLFGMLTTSAGGVAWRKLAGVQTPGALSSGILHALARLRDALRYYWSAIAVLGLVSLVYVWFASSGTLTTWTSQTRYYADLARGFQKGHLYLAIKVAPSIIKSPDPYEPIAPWVPQGPVDYAYYQGRYYLAWEPVPALIVLFVQESLHRWLGDLQLSFGVLCGVFTLQCLLLSWIWEHYCRDGR